MIWPLEFWVKCDTQDINLTFGSDFQITHYDVYSYSVMFAEQAHVYFFIINFEARIL
jgi:hypothetical protein